jgi:hypothetical protein
VSGSAALVAVADANTATEKAGSSAEQGADVFGVEAGAEDVAVV